MQQRPLTGDERAIILTLRDVAEDLDRLAEGGHREWIGLRDAIAGSLSAMLAGGLAQEQDAPPRH